MTAPFDHGLTAFLHLATIRRGCSSLTRLIVAHYVRSQQILPVRDVSSFERICIPSRSTPRVTLTGTNSSSFCSG